MNRLAAVVLGVLAAAACGRDRDAPEVPTIEVERVDELVRRIRAEGTLQAVEATPLLAPPDSTRPLKIAWLAPDGSEVAEGDVIVRFDESEMMRELADSRDDVTSAERSIGKERVEGATARRKRDLGEDLAGLETRVAEELESHDERILSRVEMLEGAIDLELARAKTRHARKARTIEGAVSESELEVHRIAREQSSREVGHAEAGLQDLQVRAPHAGIVVLARDWRGQTVRVGESVWRGQKLAELPLLATMKAQVFVLEADAGRLAEGLPAEVEIDARPGVVYVAEVGHVDTLAQPRHPKVPVNYFGVTLELERTDATTMRVGQRVRATILVTERDVVVVPREAVFDRDGRSLVYRLAGDAFEPVEVTLGSASAGRVVITSGIEPGDHIALRDPTRPADPDRQPGEDAADAAGPRAKPGAAG